MESRRRGRRLVSNTNHRRYLDGFLRQAFVLKTGSDNRQSSVSTSTKQPNKSFPLII